MDLGILSSALVPLLMPYLVRAGQAAGESMAEEAGRSVAAGGVRTAHKLWKKLGPRIEDHNSGRAAVQRAADNPADESARAALAAEIRKVLSSNPDLAGEVKAIYDVKVRGDGNVIQIGSGVNINRGHVS